MLIPQYDQSLQTVQFQMNQVQSAAAVAFVNPVVSGTLGVNGATIGSSNSAIVTGGDLVIGAGGYVGNVSAGNVGLFRNRVINGSMRMDQRNNGAALLVGGNSNLFVADRFVAVQVGPGSNLYQQVTLTGSNVPPVAGMNRAVKVQTTATVVPALTGSNVMSLQHRVEGNNLSDFGWGGPAAKPAQLSFYINASAPGTYSASVRNGAGTRAFAVPFAVATAGAWQRVGVAVPGDTAGAWAVDASVGATIDVTLAASSNIAVPANGAWQTVTNGTFPAIGTSSNFWATASNVAYVTGVQLEAGSIATPFEFRPVAIDQVLCQRYYTRLGGDVVGDLALQGYASAAGQTLSATWPLPTSMRANPSSVALVGGATGTVNLSGAPAFVVGTTTAVVSIVSAAAGVVGFSNSTGTGLAINAEL